jgi:ribosomal protein L11 methyltransferase
MIYKEISVNTTSEAADLVADVLYGGGGNGICISDKKDLIWLHKSDLIWDYIDKDAIIGDDGVAVVKGFVPEDCFAEKYAEILKGLDRLRENSVFPLGSLEITVKEVNDNEWYDIWKKHYKPVYIKDLIICPVWSEAKGKNVIYLDPGMAFGTGEHETTRMCLELMQEYGTEGKTVVDIGCGSGILGVSAAVLGAKKVYMSDIDPVAICAAEKCACLNKVQNKVSVSKDIARNIKGDIVLLNIVADVLIYYAEKVKCIVNGGASVILSGIIEKRLEDVVKAYNRNGFITDKVLRQGEWFAVSFKTN